ncbi:hypothetical protein P1P68_26420 [Streptomyces scabiei]|uniref:hypothetical protein n=1 Tax=Streptomyces scabiei TaxID=1930 RepID=UPI00298FE8B6|nr:hypothetical protein [Streptomyces scabiei]MDW8808224.1 hypothetical protein [Streptomyces scabiei]
MATGRAPWPRAALVPALLAGVLAAGCTAPGTPDAVASARDGGAPSPSATPREEVCAKLVTYWAREVLDSGAYGDYQSMGLSNGQYEILRTVVDAARAERRRTGPGAADRLIERRARTDCEAWYRSGGPGEEPWR